MEMRSGLIHLELESAFLLAVRHFDVVGILEINFIAPVLKHGLRSHSPLQVESIRDTAAL